jgi:DNA-binding CsgD family transcriptional regulator
VSSEHREPRQRIYSPAARRFRDHTILRLLAQGMTAKQVGEQVGLSEGHVNTRIYAMRQEFGARNVTHLVALAIQEGVIGPTLVT